MCYRWTGWADWYVWSEDLDPDSGAILLPLLRGDDEPWPHVCRLLEYDAVVPTSRAVPVTLSVTVSAGARRRRRMVPAAGLVSFAEMAQAVGAASVFDSCPALPRALHSHLTVAQVMAITTQVRTLLALPARRSGAPMMTREQSEGPTVACRRPRGAERRPRTGPTWPRIGP